MTSNEEYNNGTDETDCTDAFEITEDMSPEVIMKRSQREPCNIIEMVAAECQDDFNQWMIATSKYCNPLVLKILDCNEPWTIPNVFQNFKRLATLKLIGMEYLECFPSSLFGIKTLKTLHLECLECINKVPYRLNRLRNLENLIIRDLYCLEAFPRKLGELKELQYFEMTDCPNACIPEHFNNNSKLQFLKIVNTATASSSILKILTQSLHDDCLVEIRNLSEGGEVTYNVLKEAINFCLDANCIICPGVEVRQFTVEQIKCYLEQVDIKK